MKVAIITINKSGEHLAKKLKVSFPNARIFDGRKPPVFPKKEKISDINKWSVNHKGALKDLVKGIFNEYDGLIFIAALGITVRLIHDLIKSKLRDPAVVSVDTAGRFSISVVSGHEGGANRLAFLVASSLDALPVVTTGREVHKEFILGIGTRRGIGVGRVKRAINKAIEKKGITLEAIRLVATVDLKKNEAGLTQACRDLRLPLVFISKESIGNFKGSVTSSEVVRKHTGLDGVCEPCALLAGRRSRLILKKEVLEGVTVALAKEG